MALLKMGLRNKALTALILVLLIILLPASLITWQVFQQVHKDLAINYAENLAELNRYKIRAPVSRELLLSQQFARASVTRDWFAEETNQNKAAAFFMEANSYRQSFDEQAYFAIHAQSKNYYFDDSGEMTAQTPSYQLSSDKLDDGWFFNIMASDEKYSINVNPDQQLGTTRVWFNVPVFAEGQKLGLVGTGLDLTRFISQLLQSEAGVTTMAVDTEGFIQAHPDASLIAYGSGAGLDNQGKQLSDLVSLADQATVSELLNQRNTETVQLVDVDVDGTPHLLVMTFIAELDWYVASLINLDVAEVVSGKWWYTILLGVGAVILLIILALAVSVQRILIQPLSKLQSSANALAQGQYDVNLPAQTSDEIGDLSRAFSQMIQTIQSHTHELESKVQERTRDLQESSREIALINKMVNDSIDYARLIQQAILPDMTMQRNLSGQCCIVWLPRDTVGGDFYVYHQAGKQQLLGLVDCAGHGVPGALMTMLARAALDHAIREHGLQSPAALLQKMDEVLRGMLLDLELPRGLATNMDAGLVVMDSQDQKVTFSGAKLSLYAWNGQALTEYKGARRQLVGRKPHIFTDTVLTDCQGLNFYLTTDGYLDQPGGDNGYGLRFKDFEAAIRSANSYPLAEQGEAIRHFLDSWKADAYAQRDDICVIGFCLS
ncbi:Serine phosphatase RsbU, regulator of sigma subunit [Methylophaga frappieri]|uniref:Serine phosphatase RsbU, regulator of sigma subunit n=1 Tax=Methylophaga frappieri (strain ATCC BAA-2434 / DSM 25690 / JAM7) TaxID=754477 RepID=I1YF09_METFJ|nr:biofilm regulation protein phosphatase SiaA [Methylophaga frappieri]AFJ01502.1 Serine phosphatase RsbU, regulator of sigma subunit [Methylophaga frappieri]